MADEQALTGEQVLLLTSNKKHSSAIEELHLPNVTVKAHLEEALTASPLTIMQCRSRKDQKVAVQASEAESLLQRLKQVRQQVAQELRLPPQKIFGDAALRAMALQRPQTPAHFAALPWIKPEQIDRYFELFVQTIREYCQERHLIMELEPLNKKASPLIVGENLSFAQRRTLKLYQEGKIFDEIVEVLQRTPEKVLEYFAYLIEIGAPVDIEWLLASDRLQTIIQVLQHLGGDRLKPVKEVLGEDYTYGEIRLARAWWRHSLKEHQTDNL